MTTTSVILFGCLVALAVALTWISTKVRFLPVRFGAFIAWLVPGIWLLTSGTTGFEFTNLWVQALGALLVLMAFVPLLLQLVVETRVTSKGGTQYTIWSKKPTEEEKKPTSKEVYLNRRKAIREIVDRSRR